jgi:hypothetical protein
MLPRIPAGPQTRSPDSGVWCRFFCLSNRSRLLLSHCGSRDEKQTTSISEDTRRRVGSPKGLTVMSADKYGLVLGQVLQVAEELERLFDGGSPTTASHWLERPSSDALVLFCGRWSLLK